jgi:hypothetical protein
VQVERRRGPSLPVFCLVGGILVLVAYGIRLGTVAGRSAFVQIKTGGLDIVLGVLLILLALGMMVTARDGGGTGLSIAELVVGGITLALGLYLAVSDEPFLRRAADAAGIPLARVRAAADHGFVTVSRGAGTYLILIGGALAVVGTIVALASGRRRATPAPTAGMPLQTEAEHPSMPGPLGAAPPPPGTIAPPPPEAPGLFEP